MCATLTARRPWSARSTVASGLVAGTTGAGLFIVVHSLLIVPIWTRLLGHLPFALAAGVALALAYDEAALAGALWRSMAGSALFGLITFATLAPPTTFSNALRATGTLGGANGWPGVGGTLAIAAAAGAASGWLLTRRRRGALVFGASTLALTIAMGGAIPVVNSARATLLFVGFLPICVGAGIALGAARRCLTFPECS